jgi:Rieske Fe-S protein
MEWIRVGTKDPENYQNIIVTDGICSFVGCYYAENDKITLHAADFFEIKFGTTSIENFTHWMPLPELPKK